jgi:hypothetical protein
LSLLAAKAPPRVRDILALTRESTTSATLEKP